MSEKGLENPLVLGPSQGLVEPGDTGAPSLHPVGTTPRGLSVKRPWRGAIKTSLMTPSPPVPQPPLSEPGAAPSGSETKGGGRGWGHRARGHRPSPGIVSLPLPIVRPEQGGGDNLCRGPGARCGEGVSWGGCSRAARPVALRHGTARHCMAQHGPPWHGVAQGRRLSLPARRAGRFPAGRGVAGVAPGCCDQGSRLQCRGRGSSALLSPPLPAWGHRPLHRALGRFLWGCTELLWGPKEKGRNLTPINCPIVLAVVIIGFANAIAATM